MLDIGCGTGILSMFAAKMGARHVIGVDMADIIDHTRQIVQDNGFTEKITLVKGKVEELDLAALVPAHVLGEGGAGAFKVDVIVSEWMGYCLLYESMLDTVLFARDRWLRAPVSGEGGGDAAGSKSAQRGGGVVLPNAARMFVEGFSDAEYWGGKVTFWDDVYGFNMSCMREERGADVTSEAVVAVMPAASVNTSRCEFKALDMQVRVVVGGGWWTTTGRDREGQGGMGTGPGGAVCVCG